MDYSSKWEQKRIHKLSYHEVYGEAATLEGNCKVVVSFHVFANPGDRNKGFGKEAHEARLKWFKENGYQYVICTVNSDNARQIHILEKFGWNRLASMYEGCDLYGRSL